MPVKPVCRAKERRVKFASLLLLITGWVIVLAALVALQGDAIRSGFVIAGVAVEALGLTLLLRAHMNPPGRQAR
jgi:hypothetical protein